MNPSTGIESTPQQIFNAAYWAAQSPAVQALQTATSRIVVAMQLSNAGYTIDPTIMALGADPYDTMMGRATYNIPWVEALGMQPLGAVPGYALPGVTPEPGQLPYPTTMPGGWIPTKIAVSDYPPFNQPAPPPVPVPPFKLGPQIATDFYMLLENSSTAPIAGETLTIGGVTGTVVQVGPFAWGLQVN